jgi:hypothetical protein
MFYALAHHERSMYLQRCSLQEWQKMQVVKNAARACRHSCCALYLRRMILRGAFLWDNMREPLWASLCSCCTSDCFRCRSANVCLAKCYAGIPRDVLREYAPEENHKVAFKYWLDAAMHSDPEAMHFVAQVACFSLCSFYVHQCVNVITFASVPFDDNGK